MKKLFTLIACTLILVLLNKSEVQAKTGYIFVGDSRFVQMDEYVDVDSYDNCFCVAESGKGYNWLASSGLSQIDTIQKENDCDDWKIIINLGVNDLYHLSSYLELYDLMSSKCDLYLLSVNPVGCDAVSREVADDWNNNISAFNKGLKSSGQEYLDCYSYLMSNGFATADGIHYRSYTYQDIWSFMYSELGMRDSSDMKRMNSIREKLLGVFEKYKVV